jgi:imidazolonepropionase-like amidohydrolase
MPGPATAILGATVVPLDRPGTLPGWGVLVRDGTVVEMRPAEELPIPDGAEIVRAEGRYLLPGFVDMHVHIGFPALLQPADSLDRESLIEECAQDLPLYLANGVTTVRNMSGAPFHLRLAAEIEAGRVLGPRLRTTSPILDGSPPVWSFSPEITDPSQARGAVKGIRDEGYEAIKVYNHLSAAVYEALAAEGRRVGLPVVGHVPFAVGIGGALAAGQRSIEHFRGYDFDPDLPPGASGGPERFRTWLSLTERQLVAYAEATRTAGAWNCPTLVTVDACASVAERGLDALPATARYLTPGLRETMVEGIRRPVFTADVMRTVGEGKLAQLRFLKLLHEAGNRLLAGTDASLLAIVPGFSIHDEMRNFVAAGLTPLEALTCCCRNPALFYGDEDAGRIGPGARADLILLDADPLRDIAHTRRIAGVMANGRWLPVEWLLARLDGAKPGSVLAGPPPPDGRAGPNAFSHLSAGGHTDAA